jgi:predicted nicotinamide N-methyase
MADLGDEGLGLFQEPQDFYQPEQEPTFEEHQLLSGEVLRLRLVGHNPLWGHLLWNAGRIVSDYIEQSASRLVEGKFVLEFGAGAGLPSVVSALKGASQVVVTDYPDADLVENLRYNCAQCAPRTSLAAEVGQRDRNIRFVSTFNDVSNRAISGVPQRIASSRIFRSANVHRASIR